MLLQEELLVMYNFGFLVIFFHFTVEPIEGRLLMSHYKNRIINWKLKII